MKIEDLKNTKINLPNIADRIKFQEKVFSLGMVWKNSRSQNVSFSYQFFFIDDYLDMTLAKYKDTFDYLKNTEISLEDVLSI